MFNTESIFLLKGMNIDMRKYKHDQFSLLLFIIFNHGVKVVISKSFERIHRSNLVGMVIIPLCFKSREDVKSLSLIGHGRYSMDLPNDITQLKLGKDTIVTTDTGKCMLCFQLLIFTCFLIRKNFLKLYGSIL